MLLKTAVCIDGSYMFYHTLFSAVKKWKTESPNSDILDTASENDEEITEKPDLCKYDDFLETLESKLYEALSRIQKIVEGFNAENCHTTFGKIVVALDPPKNAKLKSWRYLIYPEYKGKRAAGRAAQPFDVRAVFNKLYSMLTVSDKYKDMFGLDVVFADGCEADDIIATYFTSETTRNMKKLLIANDHDFLQLDGVTQINLDQKQIEIEQPYPSMITLTPKTYLLAKIITGDVSDNITQVFNRVGYKTAVKKYVNNLQYLTESLEGDKVAMDKFKLNTRLIDFGKIPSSITKIAEEVLGLNTEAKN